MFVVTSLVLFLTPGVVLTLAVHDGRRRLVGSAALVLTGSMATYALVGFALARLDLYSSISTWLVSLGLTASAAVAAFVRRERGRAISLPSAWDVVVVVPAAAIGMIRWLTYEGGSRFPRGWDSGINVAFLSDLQRSASLPVVQLGEPVEAYYYQGVFFMMDVLRGPRLAPFAEVKLFSLVAVVALILSATWLVLGVVGTNRGTQIGVAIAGLVFTPFLVTSAHTAMIAGLALAFALLALALEIGGDGTWRSAKLLLAALLGFGAVAVHPPSIQIAGFGLVGLTAGLLLEDLERWKRALVPAAVVAGSVLAGAIGHGVLAPALSRAELLYAGAQSSAIDTGALEANAGVAAGAVRSSMRDLVVWLIPPLAAPFALIGMGTSLVRSRLAVVGLGVGLTATAIVKVSPTNGRDYIILLVPLMLLFAIAVERLMGLSSGRAAKAGLGLVLVVIGAAGVWRAVEVGNSPAVGPIAYIDDVAIEEARFVGAAVGPDAVVASRYRPETLLIQGSTGVSVIGGYTGLGAAESFTDIDLLIESGPTTVVSREISCRYGITHVYVLRSDDAFPLWNATPGRLTTVDGVLVAADGCGGESDV